MGHTPPNTVGNKSPIAKSSTLLSPSAVRMFVPFRKHCSLPWPLPPWPPWLLPPWPLPPWPLAPWSVPPTPTSTNTIGIVEVSWPLPPWPLAAAAGLAPHLDQMQHAPINDPTRHVVNLAKAAVPAITPSFMRLRRDLRIPVGSFCRAVMLTPP